MRTFQLSLPLFIVYLVLTGNLEPANLVMGVLVSLGVSAISPKAGLPTFTFQRLPGFLWAMLRYLFVVASALKNKVTCIPELVKIPGPEMFSGFCKNIGSHNQRVNGPYGT